MIGPEIAAAALFVASLALSLIFTGVMLRLARRWNFFDRPSRRKLHTAETPLGGGVAIFLAALLPVVVAFLLVLAYHASPDTAPGIFSSEIVRHFSGVVSKSRELIAVLLGGLIIAMMGLVDDIRRLSAKEKLLVQIVVGVALASAGVRLSLFVADPVFTGALTVLWIVAVTNAFNLLDNMDGLCASVAGVLSLIFLVVAVQTGQLFIAMLLVVLLGALAGFLTYNRPPARIFMGDAGSLFTGYMLAVLTVLFTFYGKEVRLEEANLNRLYPFLVPLLIFAVPIFDTLSVIIIRFRENRPIWQADRSHFSHRLLSLGMTPMSALITVCLATYCTGISAVLLYPGSGSVVSDVIRAGAVASQAAGIILIIVLLERAARKKQ